MVQNVTAAKDHAAPHGEQLLCSAPRPDEPSKIKGFTEKGERGVQGVACVCRKARVLMGREPGVHC